MIPSCVLYCATNSLEISRARERQRKEANQPKLRAVSTPY